MSDIKYDADLEKAIPDLEVLRLRQEVAQLKNQLEAAKKILEENGLEDVSPKLVSDEEIICLKQIELLRVLSDKGLPFTQEEVKNLETLVKTLQMARGKAPIVEEKKKKKETKPDIAKLLSIAGEKKFERD